MPEAVTMPQFFAKHGYHTESMGKIFHIGHGNEGDPLSFSVPHFHDKVIEYLDPASTEGGKLTREEAYFTNQKLDRIRSLPRGAAFEATNSQDEDYADGRVAAEAIKRLRAAKGRKSPFFMAVGFVRPHLPFSAPQKYWDRHDPYKLPISPYSDHPEGSPQIAHKRAGEIAMYAPIPTKNEDYTLKLKRQLIHGYYASVSYMDEQVGKVVKELDHLGLTDNTIIVLWGDHGFHLGDLGIWTKHTNYEQANRIPLLIVAPGVTEKKTSTRQLAESVDLFPTLAELSGLPQPEVPQTLSGESLVPVLRDPALRIRDHAFHCYPRRGGVIGRAIRTERYRMVEWKKPGAPGNTAQFELYDYREGPVEQKNIAGEKPGVLARMKKILARYPEAKRR